MAVSVHKIYWAKEWTKYDKDIEFEITEVDCYVTKVGHPCAKWAIGEAWHRVSSWFKRKYAVVTLGEPQNINQQIIK